MGLATQGMDFGTISNRWRDLERATGPRPNQYL